MVETPASTLRLRIDTAALAHNWRTLDELSGSAKAGAAIKADCYGLGTDQCVPALHKAGADTFFVAHWSEVEAAAEHIPASLIHVLHGANTAEEAAFARARGAVPVVNSMHQASLWMQSGGGPCDVMIDTGINRLGLCPNEMSEPVLAQLDVDILMSHLASADEDGGMNGRQLAAFKSCADAIECKRVSMANSAGIALGGEYAFDLTRPGLSLYGGIARSELKDAIRQVAFPEAAIMQKRQINAGETVGYNAEFTAENAMEIAVVSLGYADGFLRSWNADGAGYLLHGETRLPLLGKVSMDMVVVDLTSAPVLKEGDWLSVPYSLQDAAQQTSLSQYELLTILGKRFRR